MARSGAHAKRLLAHALLLALSASAATACAAPRADLTADMPSSADCVRLSGRWVDDGFQRGCVYR